MATGAITKIEVVGGSETYALAPADYVDSKSLGASVAESFTVPAGARFGLLSATGNFYANYTTTATVPGDVTDGTASELNPGMRYIDRVTNISVIAPNAVVVTLSYWR